VKELWSHQKEAVAKSARKMSTAEYIAYNSVPEPNTGCWFWLGSVNATGYGMACRNNKRIFAHRLSYKFFHGEFPKELWVLHKCDTPLCMNPNHLFLGVAKDNTRDMNSKRRGKETKKTHCKRGHPLSGDNLSKASLEKKGKRICLTCCRAYDNKRYAEGRK